MYLGAATLALNIADIDWESSGLPPDESVGVNVPTVECTLSHDSNLQH